MRTTHFVQQISYLDVLALISIFDQFGINLNSMAHENCNSIIFRDENSTCVQTTVFAYDVEMFIREMHSIDW